MNKFACVKCSTQYETTDEDAYYCPPCLAEKKVLADTLDRKIKTAGQVPNSALTQYDAQARTMKSASGRTVTFAKA